jgi:hypothetical protein
VIDPYHGRLKHLAQVHPRLLLPPLLLLLRLPLPHVPKKPIKARRDVKLRGVNVLRGHHPWLLLLLALALLPLLLRLLLGRGHEPKLHHRLHRVRKRVVGREHERIQPL